MAKKAKYKLMTHRALLKHVLSKNLDEAVEFSIDGVISENIFSGWHGIAKINIFDGDTLIADYSGGGSAWCHSYTIQHETSDIEKDEFNEILQSLSEWLTGQGADKKVIVEM